MMPKANTVENTYIIDDDNISLFLTGIILKGFSKNLTCYYSAQQALTEITVAERNNTAPFVIFLDLNMPLMSGWDFLKAVNLKDAEFKSRCKVIILSSSIDEKEITRSQNCPLVLNFISKPLNVGALLLVQSQLLQ